MPLPTRLPGARFNSSPLVRCLSGLETGSGVAGTGPSGGTAGPQAVAETLSRWLAWTDAIALSGALNPSPAGTPASDDTRSGLHTQLAEDAARVRRDLVRSITRDLSIETDFAAAAPAPQAATDFAPYRRHYVTEQRTMAERIGPLRARVRKALSTASPALRRLAALDAVLDAALDARTRHLLGTVPALLESHAQRGRQGLAPQAWLQTLQQVLLAELETRWQPIEGLLQARAQDEPKPP